MQGSLYNTKLKIIYKDDRKLSVFLMFLGSRFKLKSVLLSIFYKYKVSQ